MDYIIDYRYPIPNCVSYDIIPFFKINYDISTEKYSVNYAYNLNFSFDKSEKIDGAIAMIMALDRAIRHGGQQESVYNDRGIIIL